MKSEDNQAQPRDIPKDESSGVLGFLKRISSKFKKKHQKTYVADVPDWTALAYWILVFSFGAYFLVRTISDEKIALPILILFPSLIGIFVILFFLPIRFINFLITEIILRILLFHTPKGYPAETVVVIGKNEYFKPSFWYAPNYDTDLLLIIHYLKQLGKPFSMYYDISIETLDEIMANSDIRTVYFVGHGRRHGFMIDRKTVVDYCRYNDEKYKKDFVYQIHCNQGGGTSLVEYVVPNENQKECLPEHGYMTNITITQMFIDKIIKHKNYGKIKAQWMTTAYKMSTSLIFMIVFIGWGYIFMKIIS